MKRWWRDHGWIFVLLGVVGSVIGIVVLRIYVWAWAHPDAPWWAFLLGSR